MTCFNRRETTLRCLRALLGGDVPAGTELTVFLLDDASPDGTADVVRRALPEVRVLHGTGSLFWSGGMRQAWRTAMEQGFDDYLWLNEDTILFADTLRRMLATQTEQRRLRGRPVIVVGATRASDAAVVTYGGLIRASRLNPLKLALLPVSDTPQACETMNGNCVLVPHAVTQTVGILDEAFVHAMGDIDYGLRARAAGFALVVSPGFAGVCERNRREGTFADATLPPRTRMRRVLEPKGLPLRSWATLTRRHGGLLWPALFLWPYLRLVVSSLSPRRRGPSASSA
jgi:GT2 family glycosyltransferase